MATFLRLSLYLPSTQSLTAKIHTSGSTRKGSCSCPFLLVSVWSEFFLCLFFFCLPIFLKYYNFQQFSPLLFFLQVVCPFPLVSPLSQQPLLLVLVPLHVILPLFLHVSIHVSQLTPWETDSFQMPWTNVLNLPLGSHFFPHVDTSGENQQHCV